MDRHRLATWSLALDDEGFAQACAALGVLSALAQRGRPARMAWTLGGGDAGLDAARIEDAVRSLHAARDEDGIVLWQMPSAVMLARLPAAAELAEAWRRYLVDAPWGTRIAVRSRARSWRDVLPMLRILQHPAVAAGGVFVADAFAADGAVDWALPFRFATLADDPLAAAFTGFRANWRQPWPYRFVVADRAQPKVEILVFSASLRQAAGQLLRSVAPSRAALALVLGGVEGDGELERLARVVAGELGADGVVCVSRPEGVDVDGMMRALVHLGDELTHNRPLDMALAQAFGGLALALLNRDLLRLSHMSHAVERIAGRLEALPNDASLAVSERSLGNLIHDRAVIDELNEAPEQARDAVMPTRGGSTKRFTACAGTKHRGLPERIPLLPRVRRGVLACRGERRGGVARVRARCRRTRNALRAAQFLAQGRRPAGRGAPAADGGGRGAAARAHRAAGGALAERARGLPGARAAALRAPPSPADRVPRARPARCAAER